MTDYAGWIATGAAALLTGLLGAGCGADDWGPDALSQGSDLQASQLARGEQTYSMYCVGCHGVNGDGQGLASRHLNPKPRDLRVGRIKFALVASGKPPRDEDYLRVITNGLHGTAMPAFPFIPLNDRQALISYIRTFIDNERNNVPGEPIAIGRDPYQSKPAKAVRDGEQLYHGLANCNSCHPSYATKEQVVAHSKAFDIAITGFRPRMYESEAKDSDWGAPILPPDFLDDPIKGGNSKDDIIRVIAAGIGGTAMPNWASSLTPKQLWALAYYVEHLVSMRGFPEGDALREQLLNQPEFELPPPPPPPPPAEPVPEGSAAPDSSAAPAASGGNSNPPDPQPSKAEQNP